jgi:RecA-family ATPase
VTRSVRWCEPMSEADVTVEPAADDSEEWVIRDIVPRGEPWMLAGKWKGGKTWTALSIGVAVALGQDWLGFANCLGRPGRVLIVALEDNRRRVLRRLWRLLRGMGLSPTDVMDNLRITCEAVRLPRDEKQFATELAEWRPDLIIIDSLSRVMIGNQNSIDDVSRFTESWGAMGKATGAAVAFLHHTNKGWEGNELPTLDDVRGSGDLVAFPRHVVLMKRRDGTVSNVAMLGNLEITHESFVLEYTSSDDKSV